MFGNILVLNPFGFLFTCASYYSLYMPSIKCYMLSFMKTIERADCTHRHVMLKGASLGARGLYIIPNGFEISSYDERLDGLLV
ncbi:hypothetical protein CMV_020096 [Castanea mollissima]|uniref:Uncharacterized protein n=1 Tax=Castanea mollissima TaxID=60419 RepID=A0A8J4QR84_9ROSI|nr:hypothetical protein CMV_020096 [Castanea mollissima]